MRRWPPLLWLPVYVGSLFILMGLGPWDPAALAVGLALIIPTAAIAVWLALRAPARRPAPRGYKLALAALIGGYVVAAIVALSVGWEYAVAALLAGLLPMTALSLMSASLRHHTEPERERRGEPKADDHTDPLPSMGLDPTTPLGDTSEHSDAEEGAPVDGSGRFARGRVDSRH
jgi:peptidoglycan/LPS O-acetylase OafA/YrhL